MPITIDEILERDRLRVQESEWAELVEELQNDPELQELSLIHISEPTRPY